MRNGLKKFVILLALTSPGLSGGNAVFAATDFVPDTILPGSHAADPGFYPDYCHDPAPQGASPSYRPEHCATDTETMRRDHFERLWHKRDQTMHKGIRTPDFSLRECVACHAAKDDSGQYVPVNEEGQFCQSCHVRVARKLDCFECHRTTPEN